MPVDRQTIFCSSNIEKQNGKILDGNEFSRRITREVQEVLQDDFTELRISSREAFEFGKKLSNLSNFCIQISQNCSTELIPVCWSSYVEWMMELLKP